MSAAAGEINVQWGLTMDVKVEGIELPFRLRIVTDNEDKMLEALSDFQSMILKKVEELG
jgi:predicted component of type VI protein secretion system